MTRNLLMAIVAAMFISPAVAQTQVPIANSKFVASVPLQPGECISLTNGKCDIQGTIPLPGWVVQGPDTGALRPGPGMFTADWTGADVAFVGGTLEGPGSITQTIGQMTVPGRLTISVAAACRLDKPCAGYLIQALFDGVVAHELRGSKTMPPGVFNRVSLSFDAAPGKELAIRLSGASRGALAEVDYDNVRLTAEQ
jgi:hypothetical protein